MIKKLICKYVHKKHSYSFVNSYWEGQKPYRWKMHTIMCKNCGDIKKIVV
jgi:hypothetical protein